jgi:hypothetical protein
MRVETVFCETANNDANREVARSADVSQSESSMVVPSQHSLAGQISRFVLVDFII